MYDGDNTELEPQLKRDCLLLVAKSRATEMLREIKSGSMKLAGLAVVLAQDDKTTLADLEAAIYRRLLASEGLEADHA